ncbi:MAG: PEGA domain-containing protein, partial [Myxococcales bacterium]|nr:PEGA domain-containing protein [Myxococcales bacterium]
MRAVLTVLLGGVVLCLTVLFPLSAQGQGAHVAVLLVDSVELPVTAEEVGRDAWMEALPGAPSGGVLAERFRERASSEPASLSATDIDSLPERSQSAVRNLALGRYEAAAEDLRTTLELADRGLEELNRETQRAREVVDACLFMVRAYLESRRKDAAWDQALRCRRMFPDVKPTSEQLHTPEVMALVRKADAHLAEGPRGTLFVDSAPRGCAVRLNGRRMGKTPLRIDDLAIYTYRVQVECRDDGDFRGRVHEVSLAKQSKVYVDTRLDAAIRTMPILSLRYESEAEREAFQMRHGAAVAALLGVDAVWMLGWDAHGNVRALRIGSDRLSPAQVVLEKGDTPAPDPRIAEAAQLLAAGRSAWIDSEGQVRSMAPPPSPQPARRTAPPQTPPDSSPVGWWGVALGVAGAVGMGIGW